MNFVNMKIVTLLSHLFHHIDKTKLEQKAESQPVF